MPRAKAFTLVEIVIAAGIVSGLLAWTAVSFSRMQLRIAHVVSDREVTNALTLAARRARAGHSNSAWGVYIPYDETTRSTQTITIFAGDNYAGRVAALDHVLTVDDDVQFTAVDFSGSAPDTTNSHEIVFAPLTGATTQYGSLTVTWYGQTRTLLVGANGIPVRQ